MPIVQLSEIQNAAAYVRKDNADNFHVTPISLSGDQFPHPATAYNNIPVIFAANDNYAPYLGVLMTSIMKNSSPSHTYDFIVLETKISEKYKEKLTRNLSEFPNVSLRFFNTGKLIENVSFSTSSHYSEETYYRLFIQTIFQHYKKIIYLDADTIALDDILKLYETDTANNLFVAALDVGTIHSAPNGWKIKGVIWPDYLRNTLGMKEPRNYYQAGVLVANIEAIKKFNLQSKALEKLKNLDPIFVDQDIINSICQGCMGKLSQEWNFVYVPWKDQPSKSWIEFLNQDDQQNYIQASKNPFLIHYGGYRPVWDNPSDHYADFWWRYARQSVFYEEILFKSTTQHYARAQAVATRPAAPRKAKYLFYKFLSKITFGKRRNKYAQKRKKLKYLLKSL
jgi:lipopolysaccharide biosynthesis glycosyltransferase